MARRRTQRQVRRRVGEATLRSKRVQRVRAALERAELIDWFDRLPHGVRQQTFDESMHLSVVADDSCPRSRMVQMTIRQIDHWWSDPAAGLMVDGVGLSVHDVTHGVRAAAMMLSMRDQIGLDDKARKRCRALLDQIVPGADLPPLMARQWEHVSVALRLWNRVDEPFVVGSPSGASLTWRLSQVTGIQRYFTIDGKRRPAWRLGATDVCDVAWIDVPRVDSPAGDRVPCFVQAHAWRRLLDRLEVKSCTGAAMMPMIGAMVAFNVTRRCGDDVWVEAAPKGSGRIGYFIGRYVDGCFVIRSFLFVTMQGTPESERLYQRLGLRRYEIERLRLDRMATFVRGDLHQDEQLCHALREAGCGHLLQLNGYFTEAIESPISAARIREVLPALPNGRRLMQLLSKPSPRAAVA
jgi:hypothetical protein